jgi:hypothetical protein
MCLLVLVSTSRAEIRPFVFGGGLTTRLETEREDANLDPITVTDNAEPWEVGAGLRFAPRDRGESASARDLHWEFRLRYARGGSDLPGISYSVVHEGRRNPYNYSVWETYEQSYWLAGAAVLVRPLPWLGIFGGPSVQSVRFEGELERAGILPDPRYFTLPSSGKDSRDIRYAVIDLGLQLMPRPHWPGIELFYSPKRFEMSNERRNKLGADGWKAGFPALRRSLGVRLVFDF